MKSNLRRLLGLLFVLAFVAASCSSSTEDAGGTTDGDDSSSDTSDSDDGATDSGDDSEGEGNVVTAGQELDVCLVTHAADGDSFWAVVEKGAEDGATAIRANLQIQGSGEVSEQSNMVDDCVANDVDGIVVSLANPEGMEQSVTAASDAGIPIVTINAGRGQIDASGIIGHVGQEEDIAGEGAGIGLNNNGVTGKVICVQHEPANVTLQSRCDGLRATYEGGEVEDFDVSSTGTADIAGTQGTLVDKLNADSDVAAIMSLNPDVAGAANAAIQEAGVDVQLATFDLGSDVLDGIEAGEILFAVDQQQYLQGYLPLIMLRLNIDNANLVGGGEPVLSGPSLVDASNVGQVKSLIQNGTR